MAYKTIKTSKQAEQRQYGHPTARTSTIAIIFRQLSKEARGSALPRK
jgi:hypothetical protein